MQNLNTLNYPILGCFLGENSFFCSTWVKKGKQRKSIYYDAKGNVLSVNKTKRRKYKYFSKIEKDKKGRIIHEDIFQKGKIMSSHSYKYDSKGNKREYIYKSTLLSFKEVYYYNKNNHCIKTEYYNDTKLIRTAYNKLDTKGNCIKREIKESDNSFDCKYKWTYSKDNKVVSTSYYKNEEYLVWTSKTIYNQYGQTKQKEWYAKGILFCRMIYEYDRNQKLRVRKKELKKEYTSKKWLEISKWFM